MTPAWSPERTLRQQAILEKLRRHRSLPVGPAPPVTQGEAERYHGLTRAMGASDASREVNHP